MATTHPDANGVVRTFDWRLPPDGHDPRRLEWLATDLLAAVSAHDRVQDKQIAKLWASVFPAPSPPTPAPPAPPPPVPPAGAILWGAGALLDQGPEGECVGYGITDAVLGMPAPSHRVPTTEVDNPYAEHIYERAQAIEGQVPDEQAGTSVAAGLKAAVETGEVLTYHWCLTIADVVAALNTTGVILGIPWLAGMMNPDKDGVIHATGAEVGGHCLWDRGRDPVTKLHTLRQAWGTYGIGGSGDVLISDADLGPLILRGEAAIITKP